MTYTPRQPERSCEQCGTTFRPHAHCAGRFCSRRCMGDAKRVHSEWRPRVSICPSCDLPYMGAARKVCVWCAPRPASLAWHACGQCGKPVQGYRARRAKDRICTACHNKRPARLLRKAIERGAAGGERFTLDEIAERDGWRCGLCHRKVDPTLSPHHPRGKTLDHIVPISRGGLHERRNAQLAHRLCNNRKHNSGEAWQQLLIA